MSQTNRKRSRRSKRSGFTLIEVMIVLFILMTLASVGVLAYNQVMENARKDMAKTFVSSMKQPLDMYKLDIGRYPTNDEGLGALVNCPATLANPAKWKGPYINSDINAEDPWGSPYVYDNSGGKFTITSAGPDGTMGTDDDIIAVSGN